MSDDSPFDESESDLDRIGTLARQFSPCSLSDMVSRYSEQSVPLKDAWARNFVIEEELATTRYNAKPASKTDKVDAFCAWDGEGKFMSHADNIDASMSASSELEAVRKAIASAPAEIANHPGDLAAKVAFALFILADRNKALEVCGATYRQRNERAKEAERLTREILEGIDDALEAYRIKGRTQFILNAVFDEYDCALRNKEERLISEEAHKVYDSCEGKKNSEMRYVRRSIARLVELVNGEGAQ